MDLNLYQNEGLNLSLNPTILAFDKLKQNPFTYYEFPDVAELITKSQTYSYQLQLLYRENNGFEISISPMVQLNTVQIKLQPMDEIINPILNRINNDLAVTQPFINPDDNENLEKLKDILTKTSDTNKEVIEDIPNKIYTGFYGYKAAVTGSRTNGLRATISYTYLKPLVPVEKGLAGIKRYGVPISTEVLDDTELLNKYGIDVLENTSSYVDQIALGSHMMAIQLEWRLNDFLDINSKRLLLSFWAESSYLNSIYLNALVTDVSDLSSIGNTRIGSNTFNVRTGVRLSFRGGAN